MSNAHDTDRERSLSQVESVLRQLKLGDSITATLLSIARFFAERVRRISGSATDPRDDLTFTVDTATCSRLPLDEGTTAGNPFMFDVSTADVGPPVWSKDSPALHSGPTVSEAFYVQVSITTEQRLKLSALLAEHRDPLLQMFGHWLEGMAEEEGGKVQNFVQETSAYFGTQPENIRWTEEALRRATDAFLGTNIEHSIEGLRCYLQESGLVPKTTETHLRDQGSIQTLDTGDLYAEMRRNDESKYWDYIREVPVTIGRTATSIYRAIEPTLGLTTPTDPHCLASAEHAAEITRFLHFLCCLRQTMREFVKLKRGFELSQPELDCWMRITTSVICALFQRFLAVRFPGNLEDCKNQESVSGIMRGFEALDAPLRTILAIFEGTVAHSDNPKMQRFPSVSQGLLGCLRNQVNWFVQTSFALSGLFGGKVPRTPTPCLPHSPESTPWFSTTSITETPETLHAMRIEDIPTVGCGITTVETGVALQDGHPVSGTTLTCSICHHTPTGLACTDGDSHIPLQVTLGHDHPLTLFANSVSVRGDNIQNLVLQDIETMMDWGDKARALGIPQRHINYFGTPKNHEFISFLLTREEVQALSLEEQVDPIHPEFFQRLQDIRYPLPRNRTGQPMEASDLFIFMVWESEDDGGGDAPPPAVPDEAGGRSRRQRQTQSSTHLAGV